MSGVFNIEHAHRLSTQAILQYSGADVSPYVNWVASLAFNDFQLSAKGARNIANCLGNLPCVETGDVRLTLGWGPEHFLRHEEVRAHGYEHLTVIVALASTFHEAYASEVCHAYAASMANEHDMLPHITQWKSQSRAVCGAFTAATFAQLVEEYIRLDPFSIGPGSQLLALRCRVDPQAMAHGLRELSKVTSKKQKQITLVGGAVISFFAALSEYFYDLQIAILSRTGEKLRGDPQNAATQVILVYHEDPDLQVPTEHWSTIQDKTGDDDPNWTRNAHYLPFGGRLQWQTLLPQVFGHAYWIFDHEEAKTLADIIGAAARCLEADYEQQKATVGEATANSYANPSSYGIGLIQNLTGWLPELRRGQGRMERHVKRTFEEAGSIYEAAIHRLQKLCDCDVCSISDSANPPRSGYCLPVIGETIIALGLAISRLVVAAGIFPTRQGVQGLYAGQAEKRRVAKFLDTSKEGPNRIEHYNIIYANEWKATPARRLQNAVELFSGTRPTTDLAESSLVAVAHEGIVAYVVDILRSDRAPPRADAGFIQISSGVINVRQKIYTRMSTEQPVRDQDSAESLLWEAVKFAHWEKPLYCK